VSVRPEELDPPRTSVPRAADPVLSVSGLTLESVRGDALVEVFQDASLELPAGEVVLLVGPSGSGKSLFAKLLAGLLGPATGTIRIAPTARMEVRLRDGRACELLGSGHYPARLRGAVGYMFQHHALFDELTVAENVRMGGDQARDPLRGRAWHDWLDLAASRVRLERLLASPIEPLSGGQRQRASLLRMLALRPEILVYDEPTSGLDPDAAGRVADMIRDAQHPAPETLPSAGDPGAPAAEPRPRLSLVVTHDYANLLRVADRVVILDERRRFEVREARTDAQREALAREVQGTLARWQAAKPRPIARKDVRAIANDAAWRAFAAAPAALVDGARALPRLFLRSWRWHARFAWNALRLLVLGAIPFTAVGGAAIGLVVAYFSLNSVPRELQAHAEPVFIEPMIQGLGLALFQVLAPLFAAICLAARSGAATAGHVSNLERSSQLDALRVLGVPPTLLLGDKIVLAFAVGMPLLAAVAFAASSAACLAVVLVTRPLATWYTWRASYFAGLGAGPLDLPYRGTWWVLAKLVPAGVICGAIAWREGARPKATSEDVNRAITRTIMLGILAVLAVFFLVLVLEVGP
jgi:ABC-type transporter Mla maintaining outer membrane lipid asymmetry ATPase subunit MlaF/ABC-type transporter Mla maintaining outer membrane lipid asymmetry permease subunit MlaE